MNTTVHGAPCRHYIGAETRYCGATDGVRLFLGGRRCPSHTPAALEGRPGPSIVEEPPPTRSGPPVTQPESRQPAQVAATATGTNTTIVPPKVADEQHVTVLEDRRAHAAAQAGRGWSLFPCGTPEGGSHGHQPGQGGLVDCERCKAEKAPRRGWKWKDRNTSDPDVIRQHWPQGDPNIGVAMLRSRLVVVDLDTTAHGGQLPEAWNLPGVSDGTDVFAHLLEQYGETWPSTYIVRTSSGGLHVYYRAIDGRPIPNSQGKVGPMIDVRGDGNADGSPGGGYVLGAGSVVGGSRYEVLDDSPPLPLPGWLADLADPPRLVQPARPQYRPAAAGTGRTRSRFVGLLDTVLNAPNGQRNASLHWAACRAAELVRDGLVDQHAAYTALTQAAEAIGLGDHEVRATINSAFRQVA